MTYFYDGKQVSLEEFQALANADFDRMAREEENIKEQYPGIDDQCAGYILYLRSRSRWTEAKELELVRLSISDKPLPDVYSGEF